MAQERSAPPAKHLQALQFSPGDDFEAISCGNCIYQLRLLKLDVEDNASGALAKALNQASMRCRCQSCRKSPLFRFGC
jgi:hypothetical protein